MKYKLFLSMVVSSMLFILCNENKVEVKTPAHQLLEKGIIGSGGWESWTDLDTIQFYKTTKLYLEDGSLEDSTYQLHTYFMYPTMNGKYSWEKDQIKYEVEYQNGNMSKSIDGIEQKISKEEQEKLRKGFLGAQFVMSLPFKLNDSGVELALDGKSTINGKTVDVLKASYHTKHQNHTESHDWWHYINAESGKLEGYKVHHPPTYARVSNVTTTRIKGVDFPTYRKTFRVDKEDNEQYVRGEFWYEYVD